MNLVEYRSEVGGFVEECFEGFDRLFFGEIQQELVLNLYGNETMESVHVCGCMTRRKYQCTFRTALSGSILISGMFASTIRATKLINKFAFFLRVVKAV